MVKSFSAGDITIPFAFFLRQYMNINGKHLVVVPKSCIGNWMNEFKNISPDFDILKFHGDKTTCHELMCSLNTNMPLCLYVEYPV